MQKFFQYTRVLLVFNDSSISTLFPFLPLTHWGSDLNVNFVVEMLASIEYGVIGSIQEFIVKFLIFPFGEKCHQICSSTDCTDQISAMYKGWSNDITYTTSYLMDQVLNPDLLPLYHKCASKACYSEYCHLVYNCFSDILTVVFWSDDSPSDVSDIRPRYGNKWCLASEDLLIYQWHIWWHCFD